MGMKIQCDTYLPRYFPMREINDDSNSCSWSPYYGDRIFASGQHYLNGFMARGLMDGFGGYDKDTLKKKMLEHEAIFKNQVYELHRLYRIQRDMMDEVKMKGHGHQIPLSKSLNSSPLTSQASSVGARKWPASAVPGVNTLTTRPTLHVEDAHSAYSSIKGSDMQFTALQKTFASKDLETKESRPTKFRRKTFDLQLPAEEYICTEEKLVDEIGSDTARCVPNGNCNLSSGKQLNPFYSNGGIPRFHESSRSESFNRNSTCLADLNVPIEIEDTDIRVHSDRVMHNMVRQEEISKPNPEVLKILDKASPQPGQIWENGSLCGAHLQNNINGRQWFSHTRNTGEVHGKSSHATVDYALEKVSAQHNSSQGLQEQSRLYVSYLNNDGCLGENFNLPITDRYKENLNGNHQDVRNTTCSYTVSSSSLLKSWEKGDLYSNQKLLHSSTSVDKNSQVPNLGHGFFADRWNPSSSSSSESRFARELPTRNGFCHGSPSGAKEAPVHVLYNDQDHTNTTLRQAPDHFSSLSTAMSSRGMPHSVTPVNDASLNSVFSNIASYKTGRKQNCEVIDVDKSDGNHVNALPWLGCKFPLKFETTDLRLDLNSEKGFPRTNEFVSVRTENENATSASNGTSVPCSNVVGAMKRESRGSLSCRSFNGHPILNRTQGSNSETVCFSLPLLSNSRKHLMFDINLPSDVIPSDHGQQNASESISNGKEKDIETGNLRCLIDLNCSTTEDESMVVPFVRSCVKIDSGIDLEASLVPETDEDIIPEQCPKENGLLDENMNMAAEIIVSISLSADIVGFEGSSSFTHDLAATESLLCLADLVCSSENDNFNMVMESLGTKDCENSDQIVQGLDYFESMTLNLAEINTEDYMPKPLVPDNLKLEEIVTPAPCRTRKVQSRRGRQRRDFRRDILPGLTSLSRHEVTEDLQVFGGLMRATGHLWTSGLTRRNTAKGRSTRGRRRMIVNSSRPVILSPPCTPVIQQLNTIEVSLEDRNLTSWGKKTRRPRRQRCPATGNSAPIPLTLVKGRGFDS